MEKENGMTNARIKHMYGDYPALQPLTTVIVFLCVGYVLGQYSADMISRGSLIERLVVTVFLAVVLDALLKSIIWAFRNLRLRFTLS